MRVFFIQINNFLIHNLSPFFLKLLKKIPTPWVSKITPIVLPNSLPRRRITQEYWSWMEYGNDRNMGGVFPRPFAVLISLWGQFPEACCGVVHYYHTYWGLVNLPFITEGIRGQEFSHGDLLLELTKLFNPDSIYLVHKIPPVWVWLFWTTTYLTGGFLFW